MKSIRLAPLIYSISFKTPLIDSKKKSITSRLFEGLKVGEKGKDKCKDKEMDHIEESIGNYDNGKDDETINHMGQRLQQRNRCWCKEW